jgi:hypothetical protein
MSWCIWSIGKGVFVKNDVTGDNDAAGSEVEAPISFVTGGVS